MLDFLIAMGKWIADFMDYVLGWMLRLHEWTGLREDVSRDIVIFVVAVLTCIVLTYARKWTTDQDLMKRCKEDLATLKKLKKQARRDKDKDAKARIQMTVAQINLTRMKAELWGLLASLIPIVLLACWAWERLDYYPPEPGDTMQVRATFPASQIGENAWLYARPQENAEMAVAMGARKLADGRPDPTVADVAGGPTTRPDQILQAVRIDDAWDPFNRQHIEGAKKAGLAVWEITPQQAMEVDLVIATGDKRMVHPLNVGTPAYAYPLQLHGGDYSTWVDHEKAYFLNYVPKMPEFWNWWEAVSKRPAPTLEDGASLWAQAVYYVWKWPIHIVSMVTWLTPWLVAYLAIAIPFVPLLRKVLKVY